MKRLLAFIFTLLAMPAVFADGIGPSQFEPHHGFIRKAPCATLSGENCGPGNPTVHHITPDQCGVLFSTGASRNPDAATTGIGGSTVAPTTGDGTNTTFTFTNILGVAADTDIVVKVAGAVKTLTTDYTLTGATNPSGGTVTFVVAPGRPTTATGDGATTAFAFGPLDGVTTAAQLIVKVGGVTKTLTTDYTVGTITGGSGTVTFTVAPANAAAISIAPPAPSVTVNRGGDGVKTAFPYNFQIHENTDLEVLVNGVIQATSAYTVSGIGSPSGGNATITVPPTVGQSVLVRMKSFSMEGTRFTLPTVAEMTAAGYTSSGANMSNGTANRSGQCELYFVMGLPGDNYLTLGMDGVQGVDKTTFHYEGTFHDIHYGDALKVPFMGSGFIRVIYNGTSWLGGGGSPQIVERMGYGQMFSHGQGRLFMVKADPSWWTVGSKINSLAYCPVNGMGEVVPNNGGVSLGILPIGCSFLDSASGTINYYVGLRSVRSISVTGVIAGAAYGAGTAPNGVSYPAGNYIQLVSSSFVNFASGDTITVHNLPMTLGSKTSGKWIGKLIDTTHVELHEEVNEARALAKATSWAGAPSSFIAGDTVRSDITLPVVSGGYEALAVLATSSNSRLTDPASGVEFDSALQLRTVVGLIHSVAGVITDTSTSRYVASWHNAMEKECRGVTASDRTTTSTTLVELNSDARCNFMALNHSSQQANLLGDPGRGVRWALTMTVANNTANDGCEIGVSFDGGAAEPAVARAMNGASVQGATTLTVSGLKNGLSETANHYITPFWRAVTGGTCTASAASSGVSAFVWQ